jgi:hypothetical protein
MAPLMCYVLNACYDNPQHLTNRDDLGMAMGWTLRDMEKWIRGLACMKRLKNYLVVNPNNLLVVSSSLKKSVKSISNS